jgi:hypothetical protein
MPDMCDEVVQQHNSEPCGCNGGPALAMQATALLTMTMDGRHQAPPLFAPEPCSGNNKLGNMIIALPSSHALLSAQSSRPRSTDRR